ncbi:MAG TPA: PilZ domain-containing protein [bacterium]|nr:PilZ domain-containing protein [bacterium]
MWRNNRERRKHERISADWEYLFAIEIDHKGKKIISEVKDISCGGLMCKVNQKFQPGKEVDIAFLVPRYTAKGVRFQRISNRGLVVRCEHYPEPKDMSCHQLAVAFQAISKRDAGVIKRFVEYARGVEKRCEKNQKKSSLHVERNCVMTSF